MSAIRSSSLANTNQLSRSPQTMNLVQRICSLAMATTTKSSTTHSIHSQNSASARGLMMILSPAKTLDVQNLEVSSALAPSLCSPCCDTDRTKQLVQVLKSKNQGQLKKIMKISDNISTKVKKVRLRLTKTMHFIHVD